VCRIIIAIFKRMFLRPRVEKSIYRPSRNKSYVRESQTLFLLFSFPDSKQTRTHTRRAVCGWSVHPPPPLSLSDVQQQKHRVSAH